MNHRILLVLALLLAGSPAVSQDLPDSEEGKMFYFLGTDYGRGMMRQFHLAPGEADWVVRGIRDALADRSAELDASLYGPRLQELAKERLEAAIEAEKVASAAFVKQAAAEPGAVRAASGLVITEVRAGNGDSPQVTDTVRVHYHGTLRDGHVFDSSVQRGKPAEFPLNRVIPCWSEGLQRMHVGGKSTLICPPEIAYGDRGAPPAIPGGAALRFEVELLDIVKKETAAPSKGVAPPGSQPTP